jgi:hypothetical protein
LQQRWRSRQTQSLAGAVAEVAAEEVAEVAVTGASAAVAAECILAAAVAAECVSAAVAAECVSAAVAAECVSAEAALVAGALGPAFAITVASVLA